MSLWGIELVYDRRLMEMCITGHLSTAAGSRQLREMGKKMEKRVLWYYLWNE